MDTPIAPKPQKIRIRWDKSLRVWMMDPYHPAFFNDVELYSGVMTFNLRLNILNRRYSSA